MHTQYKQLTYICKCTYTACIYIRSEEFSIDTMQILVITNAYVCASKYACANVYIHIRRCFLLCIAYFITMLVSNVKEHTDLAPI